MLCGVHLASFALYWLHFLHWPHSLAGGDPLPETAQWNWHQKQPVLVTCGGVSGLHWKAVVTLHPFSVATSPSSSSVHFLSPEPSSSSQCHILALCRFRLELCSFSCLENSYRQCPTPDDLRVPPTVLGDLEDTREILNG